MSIVLKHTFKNIFRKPFRTLLAVFCLFVCSFVALVSLDMSGAISGLIKDVFNSEGLGKSDIVVKVPTGDISFLEDDYMPENIWTGVIALDDVIYTDIEGEYSYVQENNIGIIGIDYDTGKKLGFVFYDKIADDEVVVSESFAEKFGYKKGDTLTLHDEYTMPVEFKIHQVVEDKGIIAGDYVAINQEKLKTMMVDPQIESVYIDLKDETLAKETCEKIEEAHPTLRATSIMDMPELLFIINLITKLTTVMFALCVLMVIFVTISISERIISERMSVVGTLRSVGVSAKTTAFILLLENAFYGLFGSILGCWLYSVVRQTFLTMFLIGTEEGFDSSFGEMNPFLYIIVILAAILIECLCPLKEILKATSTPIRDLIFMNKDTEYRFGRVGTIGGIACIIITVILFFVPENFYVSLAQVFLLTFALSLLFPYIQYVIGKLLYKLFDKTNMPIAKLAATEVYTKKSTFGSSVLITTSIALAIVIYTIAMSITGVVSGDTYASTNYIMTTGEESSYYRFIDNMDGVTDIKYIYESQNKININGKEFSSVMDGISQQPDGTMGDFVCVQNCEPLADDEIALTEAVAHDCNAKIGDEVEIIFNCDSYYPITRTFKVKCFCDTSRLNISEMNYVLSEKTFKELYGDIPSRITFNAEDPEGAKEFIEKYASKYVTKNDTSEGYVQESKKAAKSLMSLIYVAIAFGVGITFIGSVSNLLIGFEGRKRECAVLMSTSLPRKKLNRMFFLESFFSSGIALFGAIPAAVVLMKPVRDAFAFFSMHLRLMTGFGSIIGMIILLWMVFTLTSLFLMRALKKMKLAEQLKYE